MTTAYVIVVSALSLIGSGHYIWNTIKGITKPNRVSYFIWGVAPLIGGAAAISSGVTWAVLPVLLSGFSPLLVFLASFINPNSYWKLTRFDYACGATSILALVLWYVTEQPVVAIIFALASDFLAGIPTAIKAWKYPETETVSAYVTSGIGNALSFLVMKEFTFVNYAFPGYLVLYCIYLTFAILRKRLGFRW